MRTRKLHAENRSVWANTWGFEHTADAALTEKNGFQKCPLDNYVLWSTLQLPVRIWENRSRNDRTEAMKMAQATPLAVQSFLQQWLVASHPFTEMDRSGYPYGTNIFLGKGWSAPRQCIDKSVYSRDVLKRSQELPKKGSQDRKFTKSEYGSEKQAWRYSTTIGQDLDSNIWEVLWPESDIPWKPG